MEKALGLELEEFIGIPAIATFMFFKVRLCMDCVFHLGSMYSDAYTRASEFSGSLLRATLLLPL